MEILPQDRFDHEALLRRRREETERKQRFFNPRQRIIGIDVNGLNTQIQTKNHQNELESERESAFAAASAHHQKILECLAQQQQELRDAQAKELSEFRKSFQQKTNAREWDLNDPLAKRNGLPARVGDTDPRTTVSGLQKFDGEDLAFTDRTTRQKQQVRVWTLEQLFEKAERKKQEMAMKNQYDAQVISVCQTMEELERQSKMSKYRQALHDQEENLRLAQEKRRKELEAKIKETEASIQSINEQINGRLLTERAPEHAIRNNGRVIGVDAYKGMTQDELKEILRIQDLQRQEKALKTQYELRTQQNWAVQDALHQRTALLLEREQARQKRQMNLSLRQQNLFMAKDQKHEQKVLNKVVYTNKPSDEYFGQFNTSSR